MDNIKITEQAYPIEMKWIIKNVCPIAFAFLFSFFIGGVTHIERWFLFSAIIIAFLLSWLERKNFHYEFGEKFIILKKGIISKSERYIPYGRIQNISVSKSIMDNLFDLATLVIQTASESAVKPRKLFYISEKNIPRPEENAVKIPGLLYENALHLRDALKELVKKNPIDDAQSGL